MLIEVGAQLGEVEVVPIELRGLDALVAANLESCWHYRNQSDLTCTPAPESSTRMDKRSDGMSVEGITLHPDVWGFEHCLSGGPNFP